MPEIAANHDLILTPTEMGSNRWYYEQQHLRLFAAFALLRTGGQIIAAEGALDTQNNNTYGIRIVLSGFPYSLPKVFPKDWAPTPGVPHTYGDGSLCIMRSDQWRTTFSVRPSGRCHSSSGSDTTLV
jgi:hypothetical protein